MQALHHLLLTDDHDKSRGFSRHERTDRWRQEATVFQAMERGQHSRKRRCVTPATTSFALRRVSLPSRVTAPTQCAFLWQIHVTLRGECWELSEMPTKTTTITTTEETYYDATRNYAIAQVTRFPDCELAGLASMTTRQEMEEKGLWAFYDEFRRGSIFHAAIHLRHAQHALAFLESTQRVAPHEPLLLYHGTEMHVARKLQRTQEFLRSGFGMCGHAVYLGTPRKAARYAHWTEDYRQRHLQPGHELGALLRCVVFAHRFGRASFAAAPCRCPLCAAKLQKNPKHPWLRLLTRAVDHWRQKAPPRAHGMFVPSSLRAHGRCVVRNPEWAIYDPTRVLPLTAAQQAPLPAGTQYNPLTLRYDIA